MIQVNELRIGNLINFQVGNTVKQGWIVNINGKKINILTCVSYKGDYANFKMIQGAKTYTIKPQNLKPIPLTEDWLIKFGFKKDDDSWFFSLDYDSEKETFKIFYLPKESGFGVFGVNDFGLNIRYVDQLQNLYFALTNEELNLSN